MANLICIAGASGSGKTTIAKMFEDAIPGSSILRIDGYYNPNPLLSPETKITLNYDDPAIIDKDLLIEQVQSLLRGNSVSIPIYDFKTHSRLPETQLIEPCSTIILEGIFAFNFEEIIQSANLKVYVDCLEEQCLERRIKRDQIERQISEEETKKRWHSTVKPMAEKYIYPLKKLADLIIPNHENFEQLQEFINLIKNKF